MSIPFFWVPILLATSTTGVKESSQSPSQWAAAVTQRADAGWHLRDLSSSHQAESIHFSVVLASQQKAERLSLRYDLASGNFEEFTQAQVALPTEERSYSMEAALFEELSLGAPGAIEFDCSDFYLDFGTHSISLAEDDFEVPLWATSKRPGAALSAWLTRSLEYGELVDVRDERSDDGAQVTAEIVFVVDSSEGREEMRTEVDEMGRPVRLRLLHSPNSRSLGAHPDSQALQRLSKGAAVEHIRFALVGDENAELQIELTDHQQMSLDLDRFAPDEGDCGC